MSNGLDTVARWSVPVQEHIYIIEFEHGTTSGKRVIRVDGKEILRRNWMFKLTGKELFSIGNLKCAINVESLRAFTYQYTLEVNGKTYEKFHEELKRKLKSWTTVIAGEDIRICFDKETMDVWVNGQKMNTAGEFVENGTKTHFEISNNVCFIKATSSGNKKIGFIYQLFINNSEITSTEEST
ncbi:unnamed protein product [Thelazia callipaeda]|uniref:Fas apoptotic inhibitory molecule 1 n=1 Tax=Thelazia callipaeda TaxID=103827 RepID=A0A0N5D063_THECL|nr:unnamed protein product [Thelazia callipaeda]